MPEPKFATFKIKAGDYLLVANDERHLWRIRKGHSMEIAEDGSEVERPAWELYKWIRWLHGDESDGDRIANDLSEFEFENWDFQETGDSKKDCLKRSAELIPGE